MTVVQYTAEVKDGLLLKLPTEAEELHLKPGDKVQVQLVSDTVETLPVQSRGSGQDTQPTAPSLSNSKKPQIGVPPRRVSAMGKYAGVLSSEEFMRRKQEDIVLEDRPRQ